jgi:hypothetical protein
MLLEYKLKRSEIVQAYFAGLKGSARFRNRILMSCLAIGLLTFFLRVGHSSTERAFWIAVAWSVGMFLFLPAWIFIRGKTSMRRLDISQERIYTEIGSLRGEIPWSTVTVVTDVGSQILIGRSNGNFLSIPNRAFPTPAERAELLELVRVHARAAAPLER